jgi:histidyl-tRNA synthetase
VAKELRLGGINVAVDLTTRKIGDQLKAASKKQINYVLIIGDGEVKSGQLNLKDLATGHETKADIKQIIKLIKKG